MRVFGVDLTWVDMVGLIVGLVGVPLALWGLLLTYQQVTKAKTAAEATAIAVRETQGRVIGNLILVLLTQLQNIDREFDTIRANDRGGGLRLVHHWRQVGGEVLGFLGDLLEGNDEFIDKLGGSIALSTAAKDALRESTNDTVHESTADLRGAIGDVCAEIGSVTATLITQTGGVSE